MRFRFLFCTIGLLAFALGSPACSDDETEDADPDVLKGCQALCDAEVACGTGDDATCVDACVADVGTPGAECGQALEDWAACLETECSSCQDEQGARDQACGGTG